MAEVSTLLGASTIVGTLLSLIGVLIGLYTLIRVRKVARVQADERRITQELIGVDQIELDLRRVITKLNLLQDPEAAALATDLSIKLGAIQGVRRALDSPHKSASVQYVRLEKGFFGEEFVVNQIDRAHSNIDIITGRTLLVAGFYVMDRLRQACERGVLVRVIGLSDCSDDSILADALKTVSNPAPKDAADYRRQILQNKNDILTAVTSWTSPPIQARFQYRMSPCVPRVSLLRADNMVNLGFLQFYRDAQPKELRDREYIRIPANAGVGQVALKHFEIAWSEGTPIFPLP